MYQINGFLPQIVLKKFYNENILSLKYVSIHKAVDIVLYSA